MRIILAIFLCKLARRILRITGRGGTHLPGVLALKVCPNLLASLAEQVRSTVITGTNGKTTSARMLEETLQASGLAVFSNRSGANLVTGITAEFAANATWRGKMRLPDAVIECDEAQFRLIARVLDAKVILVTNVFRDQLDRFGELAHTVSRIRDGIAASPNATVCINADCALSVGMMEGFMNPVCYFGVETPLYNGEDAKGDDMGSEITRCTCGQEYAYESRVFGHLGKYHCTTCGKGRPAAYVRVAEVITRTADTTTIMVQIRDTQHEMTVNMPGAYNIYNAAGVIAAAETMKVETSVIAAALAAFRGGFGRMEKLTINGRTTRMILVKNPVGFSQVLRYLAGLNEPLALAICLNDRMGDSKDISWIWDADSGVLAQMGERLTAVYASGIRADDLAVWLKYAGVAPMAIRVMPDYDKLLETAGEADVPMYILPTYSAMIDLRDKLSKKYGAKYFWE